MVFPRLLFMRRGISIVSELDHRVDRKGWDI
jgi:hypothetical protein